MRTQIPLPKKGGHSPQFSAHVYCDQTAVYIRIPLGTEVGLSLDDILLNGDPAPPRKKGTAPTQFLAHVYCGQMAGWIKVPLGTEVNRGPGDIVRWSHSSSLKRHSPPVFGLCLLWPHCSMDEDATCYGSRPDCVRRGPSSPTKGAEQSLLFGPCLLWPRSPITATAQLLFKMSAAAILDFQNLGILGM